MHYGWIIVFLTFISILVAAGIRSITGVIMVPLEEEFSWSRSSISLAFAINLILYGFSGPFIAAGLEKLGIRKTMIYAMILLVFGLSVSIFMVEIWQLQFIWGVIIAIGSSVFLTVLAASVANNWFEKRRGFVLGLLMGATAAGQMIFLPLLSFLTEEFSWRFALAFLVLVGIVMIPVILIWMRDKPSEKGLQAYGSETDEIEKADGSEKSNPISNAFGVLSIGIKSVPFWLLSISFFICGFSTIGLIGTHFIPASTHHGIPEVHAASLLAFMGIFNIAGTMLSGWLSDKFDSRWLLFWYYGLRGLSLLILPYAFEMQSYALLIGFAVFYGLDWIATVPPTIRLASDHFGKAKGVIIYGWVFAAHQVGAGVAAFLAGYFYEAYDSYTISFISAGILCLVATLFVISVKSNKIQSTVPKQLYMK